jgi:hypothetical protein
VRIGQGPRPSLPDVPSGPRCLQRGRIILQEALAAMGGDTVIREAISTASCDYYMDFKRQEWADNHNTISPWEQEKYLTLF